MPCPEHDQALENLRGRLLRGFAVHIRAAGCCRGTRVRDLAGVCCRDTYLVDVDTQLIGDNLRDLHAFRSEEGPAALKALQQAALDGSNTFDALMEAAKRCSLGDISGALYEVGGQYRRNM